MSDERKDFAFTLKFNEKGKKDCIPSDYDCIFVSWKKRGIDIVTKRYEPDSKGICHVHGILNVKANFYWRQLEKGLKGIAWKVDPITDREGWIRYINKQQIKLPFKLFKVNNSHSICVTPTTSDSDQISEDECSSVIAKLTKPLFKKQKLLI